MTRRALALATLVVACGGHHTEPRAPTARPAAVRVAPPSGEARIDPDAVRSVIRAARARFLLCYAAGLQKKSGLAGRVETRFVIDETCHAIAAEDVTHGNVLPDDAVRACVVAKFRRLEFPPPKPSGKVPITYPLLLDPSMVALDHKPTPPSPAGDDYHHGRPPFDRAAAGRALTLAEAEVRACKGFQGTGHVRLTFDPSGVPTKTRVDSPAGMPAGARDCVEKAFGAARVPVYEGDAVTVGKSFRIP